MAWYTHGNDPVSYSGSSGSSFPTVQLATCLLTPPGTVEWPLSVSPRLRQLGAIKETPGLCCFTRCVSARFPLILPLSWSGAIYRSLLQCTHTSDSSYGFSVLHCFILNLLFIISSSFSPANTLQAKLQTLSMLRIFLSRSLFACLFYLALEVLLCFSHTASTSSSCACLPGRRRVTRAEEVSRLISAR